MNKFCSNCGAEIADNDMFCPSCSAPQEVAPNSTDAKPKFQLPANLNKNKLIGIGAIAVAAILVIVILVCTLSGGYEKPIDTFFDVMIEGEADKLEDLAPAAYWEWLEDETDYDLEDMIDRVEDEYEDTIDELEEEYGDDVDVSYDIIDKAELHEDELDNIQDGLKKHYDISKKDVTEAYKVMIKMTYESEDGKYYDYDQFIVTKIDGDWYLTTSERLFLHWFMIS